MKYVEVFTMIVLIVLISCGTGVLTTYFKTKRKGDPQVMKRLKRLEQLVGDESLEERVRALEAIVTDRKRNLDQEIRSL